MSATRTPFYGWPKATGLVWVRFIIGPSGDIVRIEVPVDEIGIEELGCCIAERVASFRFPEPEGGGVVVVTYPFLLKATP